MEIGILISVVLVVIAVGIAYRNQNRLKEIGAYAQGIGAFIAALGALIAAFHANDIIKEVTNLKSTLAIASLKLDEVKKKTDENAKEVQDLKKQIEKTADKTGKVVGNEISSNKPNLKKIKAISDFLSSVQAPETMQLGYQTPRESLFKNQEANDLAKEVILKTPDAAQKQVKEEVKRKLLELLEKEEQKNKGP